MKKKIRNKTNIWLVRFLLVMVTFAVAMSLLMSHQLVLMMELTKLIRTPQFSSHKLVSQLVSSTRDDLMLPL